METTPTQFHRATGSLNNATARRVTQTSHETFHSERIVHSRRRGAAVVVKTSSRSNVIRNGLMHRGIKKALDDPARGLERYTNKFVGEFE